VSPCGETKKASRSPQVIQDCQKGLDQFVVTPQEPVGRKVGGEHATLRAENPARRTHPRFHSVRRSREQQRQSLQLQRHVRRLAYRLQALPPPVGAENSVTLCDLGILVDQAAEPVSAENPDVGTQNGWMRTPGRRALLQCPVRPVSVVVIDVLAENEPEMPFAGDQHPVQALAADAGNPAFGDRVRARRPDRRPDDPHAGRGEHSVEGRGELGVPVPDQELEAVSPVFEVHQQVTGLLGHLLPRRVDGDPGQVHPPGTVLDEEQHIQAAQEHGVDVKEVRRQDRLRLGRRLLLITWGRYAAPSISAGCWLDVSERGFGAPKYCDKHEVDLPKLR